MSRISSAPRRRRSSRRGGARPGAVPSTGRRRWIRQATAGRIDLEVPVVSCLRSGGVGGDVSTVYSCIQPSCSARNHTRRLSGSQPRPPLMLFDGPISPHPRLVVDWSRTCVLPVAGSTSRASDRCCPRANDVAPVGRPAKRAAFPTDLGASARAAPAAWRAGRSSPSSGLRNRDRLLTPSSPAHTPSPVFRFRTASRRPILRIAHLRTRGVDLFGVGRFADLARHLRRRAARDRRRPEGHRFRRRRARRRRWSAGRRARISAAPAPDRAPHAASGARLPARPSRAALLLVPQQRAGCRSAAASVRRGARR